MSASVPSAARGPAAALPSPIISDFTNFPNPFDSRKAGLAGKTEITYELSVDSHATLTIYDLLGHQVLRWDFPALQNGGRAGPNVLFWDGTNERGQKVSKGGYIAQLEITSPNSSATVIRKIAVIH